MWRTIPQKLPSEAAACLGVKLGGSRRHRIASWLPQDGFNKHAPLDATCVRGKVGRVWLFATCLVRLERLAVAYDAGTSYLLDHSLRFVGLCRNP
jgi:hypothetical protein